MNRVEMDRYFDALSEIRVKCSCSHTMYFPVYESDIKICSHCGKKVYRNERVKFKSLLLKQLSKKEVYNVKNI